ncbi:hypothetical protein VFPBJ_07256 [Purpureocillium lilacinum]|uniref:Uncharacterized protein n=1 Tax=Purpureocillium lilacinum TaxID=33203 RepID=A0A179GMM0_PURLI|nr:hypothetical protein VFPBJ_07256 [Purpureocillium lilacinum]
MWTCGGWEASVSVLVARPPTDQSEARTTAWNGVGGTWGWTFPLPGRDVQQPVLGGPPRAGQASPAWVWLPAGRPLRRDTRGAGSAWARGTRALFQPARFRTVSKVPARSVRWRWIGRWCSALALPKLSRPVHSKVSNLKVLKDGPSTVRVTEAIAQTWRHCDPDLGLDASHCWTIIRDCWNRLSGGPVPRQSGDTRAHPHSPDLMMCARSISEAAEPGSRRTRMPPGDDRSFCADSGPWTGQPRLCRRGGAAMPYQFRPSTSKTGRATR